MAGVGTFHDGPADGDRWAIPDDRPPMVLKFPTRDVDCWPDWAAANVDDSVYFYYTIYECEKFEFFGSEWRAVYRHADGN